MIIVDKTSADFSSAYALKSALVCIAAIALHMLTGLNTAYVRQQTESTAPAYYSLGVGAECRVLPFNQACQLILN
ncbi:MAG: hypothetical protein ABIO88_12880 [Burkholderiaceae bacterium]